MTERSELPWLTDDELRELTGYKRPSRQIRWLLENGIRHWVNGLGHVRVPRDALAMARARKDRTPTEPDWSKMRKIVRP